MTVATRPRLSLALLVLAACNPAPAPTESVPAPAKAPEAQVEIAARAEPKPVIDDTEARALLTRWLDAQNKGDFATYEKLYATRAYGEKRAGPRLYKFDRKGWLKDRQRMFARPMSVGAENVQTKAGIGTTTLSFEQTFSQASFQDRGQKRITLVRERGEARISTELMLASQVSTEDTRAADDFFFVVHVAGRAYVVLERGIARSLGTGAPEKPFISEKTGTYVVLQATTGLSPSQSAFSGKPLRVVGRDGAICNGKVAGLKLMAAIVPHFGMVQAWQGTLEPDHPGPKASEAEIAQSVLDSVWDTDLALVGAIEGCDGEFAVSPARAVRVYSPAAPSAALESQVRDTLLSSQGFRDAQREFVRAGKDDDSLDTKQNWPEAVTTRSFGSDATLLSVHAHRGDGCDSYTENLTVLYRQQAGRLTELGAARPTPMPSLVVDLDEDQVLELVMGEGEYDRDLVRFSQGKPVVLKGVPTSFLDCGC